MSSTLSPSPLDIENEVMWAGGAKRGFHNLCPFVHITPKEEHSFIDDDLAVSRLAEGKGWIADLLAVGYTGLL